MTSNEALQFTESRKRVYSAQDRLLEKLFGFIPEAPGELTTTYEVYVKAMRETEAEFNLEEGDPDMVLFILEQLSRSPRIIKGAEDNE